MTKSTHESTGGGDYEISAPSIWAKQPLVSVLLLAYNHGAYLAQAIDSVLGQCVDFPIELIIGEDCSNDGTRKIALRYQSENPGSIRVITADSNVGAMANYRRVLHAARGRFIAYLDGDDFWFSGKLRRQIAFLQNNSDCVAVFTNAVTVDRNGERIGLFNDAGDLRFGLSELLRRGNFLNNSSMVFRETLRGAQFEMGERVIDYTAHLLRARTGYLVQLSEPLSAYRIDSIGSMVSRSNDLVREFYWEAILSVPRELVTDDDFAHGIADFMRRVTFRALRTRRWALALQWAPRVFQASPYGVIRTSLLVAGSITRIGCKEFMGQFQRAGRASPQSAVSFLST